MSNWVLFTGLVRSPEAFLEKLAKVEAWKISNRIDGVVVSTWHGELEKYPEVCQVLSRLDAKVIEADQPPVRSVGHVLHQMVTLRQGLLAIPKGALVLKVRPEMGGIDGYCEALWERGLPPCEPPPGWPQVFQRKVLIFECFVFSPLYINDIQFAGLREDLLKLVSFDLTMELCTSGTSSEQWFYASAYRSGFPIFERFMEVNANLVFNRPEAARRLCLALMAHPMARAVIATYHKILVTYHVFARDIERDWRGSPAAYFEFNDLYREGFVPGVREHVSAHHPAQGTMDISLALLEGRLRHQGTPLLSTSECNQILAPGYQASFSLENQILVGPHPLSDLASILKPILGHQVGRYVDQRKIAGLSFRYERGPTPRLVALDATEQVQSLQRDLQAERQTNKKLVELLARHNIRPEG